MVAILFWVGVYLVGAGFTAYKVAEYEAKDFGQDQPDRDDWAMATIVGSLWPVVWLFFPIYWVGKWFMTRKERKE